MTTNKPAALRSLVFTIFLNMLGVGIIIPILTPLFVSGNIFFGANVSEFTRTLFLGLTTAIFPLAQFFGAPLLGAWSDRSGRRPVLLLSIGGTAISLIFFGISIVIGNIWLLIFSRFIDGLTGGNISVATAAIADISEDKDKAKNFALVGMAFGLGFIAGPLLGGLLGEIAPSLPIFFAAGLSVINLIWIWFMLHETMHERTTTKISIFTGFVNLAEVFKLKNERRLFLASFFITAGFTFFTSFFQVFLIDKFDWTPGDIGKLFGFIGFWLVFTQGFLIRRIKSRPPSSILRISILLLAFALLAEISTNFSWVIWLVTPLLSISNGFTNPNMTAIISQSANRASQGQILGINQSVQAIAMSVPPLLAGFIAAYDSRLPTFIGAICVLIAWALIMAYHRNHKVALND